MKPVVKGLLIGCGVLFVAAVIAIIVAVQWFRANKDKIREQADQQRAEGREFGRTAATPACVAKAMELYRADSSLLREVRIRVWLGGCFESAAPDPALCTGVPPTSEIMRTVQWRLSECSRLGLDGDKGCTRILQEVQRHCADRPRR